MRDVQRFTRENIAIQMGAAVPEKLLYEAANWLPAPSHHLHVNVVDRL
jgi:hypothetical protein